MDEINTSPKLIGEEIKDLYDNSFIDYFKYFIKIDNIKEFDNKISIVKIKEELDFIKDKKIMVCFYDNY